MTDLEKFIFQKMSNILDAIVLTDVGPKKEKSEIDTTKKIDCNTTKYDIQRNILSISMPLSYKLYDKIFWNDAKPKCIVMGYNPSLSTYENLDRTNKKMVPALDTILQKGGYYLINYYPIVDSDPEAVIEDTSSIGYLVNDKYSTALVEILKYNLEHDQLPLVLMWGPTLAPDASNEGLLNAIKDYQKSNLLFCTCKKTTEYIFIHGSGRRVASKNYHFPLVSKVDVDLNDNTYIIDPPSIVE